MLLLLGLCFGSFVNALVWRLHQQSLPVKKQAAKPKDLSISTGRSMCPRCKHTLSALDLLPVISWLALKGRCRYCRESIGWQYPLVEITTAALFILSYVVWPLGLETTVGVFVFAIWLVAIVIFMALIVYDVRWMLLPNKLVFPLIGLSVFKVLIVATFFGGGGGHIVSSVLAAAIAGGIFFVLYQLSQGKWIGGGDVKLGYALGFLMAKPELAFLMLFLASLLGLLASLPGLVTKKMVMTSKLPFGPYLIVATIVVVLFGQRLIDWYMDSMMLMVY